jgi:PAS domain S-box-containing protein
MNLKSDRFLFAGVVLALVLLASAGLFSYLSITSLRTNYEFETRAHDLIENLDALYSSIKDAEDAARGFVITGEEHDLRPFYKAQDDIQKLEVKLRFATVGDTKQVERLNRLESEVSDRLDVLQQLIEVRRRDGQLAAEESVRVGKGQFLMDQIRNVVYEMRNTENILQDVRKDEVTRSARNTLYTVVGFTLLAVGLLAFAVIVTASSIRKRSRVEGELRVTNQLQRAILDSTRYIIISTGTDGMIQTFNAAAVQWLGYSPEEILYKATPSIFHDPTEVQKRAQALSLELGTPVFSGFDTFVVRSRLKGLDDNEWTYVRKDGSRFPVQISVTTLRDSEGRITGYLTVANDISERKEAEEAARESERRYRELVENSLGLICTHTLDGTLLSVNKAVADGLGYTVEEMIGKKLFDFTVPEVAENGLPRYLNEIVNQGYSEGRLRAERKDGGVLVWAYRNRLTRQPDGTPYILGYAIDVTEQATAEYALRKAEERYRDIFDNAGDMILSVTPEGRFQYVNNTWCALLGYDEEEAQRLSVFDVMPSAIHPVWNDMLSHALSGGEPAKVELQFRARDGRLIEVEGGISVKIEEGAPVALRGIFRDVSARKRHDQRLLAQLATGTVLATAQTMDEAVPRVLQTLCENLGWELGEYWQLDVENAMLRLRNSWSVVELERSVFQVASEKITYKMGRGLPGRIWETMQPVWYTNIAQDQDNARRAAARASGLRTAWGVPVRAGNRPVGVMTFFTRREINQDKDLLAMMEALSVSIGQFAIRAIREASIRDLNNLREVLLNSAAEGIYGVDMQGRATFVNPAAAEMLGYTPEELVGRKIHYVIHHSHVDGAPHLAHECPIHTSLCEAKRNQLGNDILWRRNNTSFPVEYSSNPIFKDGKLVGAVITFRDITERKALDRMKDEFISTVSHELRTPLTSIRGSLGLLASGMLGQAGEKAQKMLTIASSNTDRLVRLINDILDIERMRSGRATLSRRIVSVLPLLQEAAELMRAMANENGIQIKVMTEDVQVEIDPDRMIQVLSNLLSNAIKFSPRGTMVTLSARQHEGQMEITVQDRGRGIPLDKLESIFTRFQQVDASDSRQKGGTGLGLAIVRTIIEQHNGQIWATNNPEGGSTFFIRIPLPSTKNESVHDPILRRRILVCDEDQWLMSELTSFLERHNYEVMQALNGKEVLDQVQRILPNAVILGNKVPGSSFAEITDAIKQLPAVANIPVLAMTMGVHHETPLRTAGGWVQRSFDEPGMLAELSRAFDNKHRMQRVLLVEDDADLSRVLAAIFEQEGIEILHAINAVEAKKICEVTVPDLVVLDITLPDASGFTVVNWMRDRERLRELPLVVYSAREVNDEEKEALRLGPSVYLVKSQVSLQQVHQYVLELLAQRAMEASHALQNAPTPTARIQ